ncbi:MAG: DNA alkylation repair protein [Spirochaetia bacterium]|jgi:3-methyladenine DNA glycosylase AlkD
MKLTKIVALLDESRNELNLPGMARFGINTQNAYGIAMPILRRMAKVIGTDHQAAMDLYRTGIHEAKILAALVDDPEQVSLKQMEEWVKAFDSWDVTDQVCTILFDKTRYSWKKALQWSSRLPEYEKRAAYSLMAGLAIHDTASPDRSFTDLYPFIITGATDERNYVKKAVSWALRNIGKRSSGLNLSAIRVAEKLLNTGSKSARWIGSDALRELAKIAF